jgi:hypothetical protein
MSLTVLTDAATGLEILTNFSKKKKKHFSSVKNTDYYK